MTTYADGRDLAHPRDKVPESDAEQRRLYRERAREEQRRWELDRVDSVVTHDPVTVDLADVFGVTKRDRPESIPGEIPGEALAAMLGAPPRYEYPGLSPEQVFAQEAREAEREARDRERREKLLGTFDAIAERKEREARDE